MPDSGRNTHKSLKNADVNSYIIHGRNTIRQSILCYPYIVQPEIQI